MWRSRSVRAVFLWSMAAALPGCSDPAGVNGQETGAAPVVTGAVDTRQETCYDAHARIICPSPGDPFFGQDGQVAGAAPAFRDNGDGTVSDLVTGLTWSQTPDLSGNGIIDARDKLTYDEAVRAAEGLVLAGREDWRLPTIKELYSLIDFRGTDPSGPAATEATPFIDTAYFDFGYGDTSAGERSIDAQFATSTLYVGTTMGGAETMFGVNFADGRIKGYPVGASPMHPDGKTFYVLFVRGEGGYGENALIDDLDGTVTDGATGLQWSKEDSGFGMDWEEALAWVQEKNRYGYLGHDDWRLPNVKELQTLVDYTRAPDVTGSPAIDPVFRTTAIVNEAGQTDFPAFWSSTTHIGAGPDPGTAAAYVCFGRCMGNMNGRWMDVHGAGAQRSDPKVGDAANWPWGRGPQGDAIRIDNFVRLVRDAGGS